MKATKRRRAKRKRARWTVEIKEHGVMFWIDHQGFTVQTVDDDDVSPAERASYLRWFAKQLRIALGRLAGGAK